jgi:outer membrane protein
VKRAQTNYLQSQLNHEQLKKSLFKNVQQAYVDASSAYKRFNASERSLQSAQEAFSFNEQRYNLGLINTYDYLLSKNNLAKAQAAQAQSKYDYIFRIKILDFYQGKPLTF